jgi:hypothetical protein
VVPVPWACTATKPWASLAPFIPDSSACCCAFEVKPWKSKTTAVGCAGS